MPEQITLTQDQQEAMDAIMSFVDAKDKRVFILRGYAGTGKTTLVKEILSELRRRNRGYNLLASTGRAAKVLSDTVEKMTPADNEGFTSPGATTIHSLIYTFDRITEDLDLFSQQMAEPIGVHRDIKLKFSLKRILEYDSDPIVYIVDESSMISDNSDASFSFAEYGNEGRLLQDLLNYDTKGQFIFIGDNCQLPPINQGISPALSVEYFQNKFNIEGNEAELKNIVRQAAGNDITVSASKVKSKILDQNVNNLNLSFPLRGYQNIHVIPNEDQMLDMYINDIRGRNYSKATFIVISNKKISALSNRIRPALGFRQNTLAVDDLLLVTQNNMVSGLMNGDLVRVVAIGRRERRANLTFVQVQVESLANGYVYSQFLIEEILYSGVTNITQEQQTTLMIDFHIRAKGKGLKQGSKMYLDLMRSDSYLNALRCIYGYVLTCHKSQGGEWDKVYLQIPRALHYMDHKYAYQWVYTAMTRAKKELYVLKDYWLSF